MMKNLAVLVLNVPIYIHENGLNLVRARRALFLDRAQIEPGQHYSTQSPSASWASCVYQFPTN